MFIGGTALARTHLVDGRLSEDIDLIAVGSRSEVARDLDRALPRAVMRSHGRLVWDPAISDVPEHLGAVPTSPWDWSGIIGRRFPGSDSFAECSARQSNDMGVGPSGAGSGVFCCRASSVDERSRIPRHFACWIGCGDCASLCCRIGFRRAVICRR
ncbi:nucleotidyl transferase AbiEii/AbiGii toxin family protein [Rhodococcus sp. G-MC3]|uniref:nucleotidyl transferase AbiEii/AbiGii toxin family protein n=1 Tax=Rhodococcus sp. G-MC3 TaxID=3046209 RepID=UPI0030146E34